MSLSAADIRVYPGFQTVDVRGYDPDGFCGHIVVIRPGIFKIFGSGQPEDIMACCHAGVVFGQIFFDLGHGDGCALILPQMFRMPS